MLRLQAETERRRKDAIYVGAAFGGDEQGILKPPYTGGSVSDEDRYESLKNRNQDFWSN